MTDIEKRVLRFLAQDDGGKTGFQCANAIGGWRRVQAYVALARLQRDGFIRAEWRGEHRVFWLTKLGTALVVENALIETNRGKR